MASSIPTLGALAGLDPPSWTGVALTMVPALLTVALVAATFQRLRQSAEGWTFAGAVMSVLVWQMSEGVYRLSGDPAAADRLRVIFGFMPTLIAAFLLHFSLFFTGRERLARSPLVVFGLYVVALLFVGLDRLGLVRGELRADALWGYSASLRASAAAVSFRLWTGALFVATAWFLVMHAHRRSVTHARRRQAQWLAWGVILPVVPSLVAILVLPQASERFLLPAAPTLFTLFVVAALFALRRGLLLDPSPAELIAAKDEALRRQADILRRAEAVANIGSWECDVRDGSLQASEGLRRLFGLGDDGGPTTYEGYLALLPDEDRENARTVIADAALTGEPFHWEHQVILPDGQLRWLETRGQGILDRRRQLHLVVGVSRDVTDQRAAAESDRIALERLLTIRKMQEVDRLRTNLLNTVGHELNTPLATLKLQLHMVRSGQFGATTQEQARSLAIVDRNLDRLARLVKDVHQVNRLQAGAFALRTQPSDLCVITRDAVEAFRAEARAAGVALAISGPVSLPATLDDDRVTQVLDNLLSNAIKCTPRGGRIDVGLSGDDDTVTVRVSDTGVGLDADQRSRLFQPFARVHDEGPAAMRGTGLGLFIIREIVTRHGGAVQVESDGPGRGATFVVTLPRAGPSAAVAPQEPSLSESKALSPGIRQGGAA